MAATNTTGSVPVAKFLAAYRITLGLERMARASSFTRPRQWRCVLRSAVQTEPVEMRLWLDDDGGAPTVAQAIGVLVARSRKWGAAGDASLHKLRALLGGDMGRVRSALNDVAWPG